MAGTGSALQAQVQYDLVTGTESVLLNNGLIFLNTGGNAVFTTGTGSGIFGSFLRLENNPNEEAFNTSATAQSGIPTTDTKAGVSLQPNALKANVLGDNRAGTLPADTYFVFGLDGQESVGGGGSTLSIDEVSLYYRSTTVESDPAFPAAASSPDNSPANIAANNANDAAKLAFIRDPNRSTLIWSTDYNASNVAANTTLLVDYSIVSGGNGSADVIFAIPKTLFPTDQNQYIYLVARLGYTTTVLLFNTVRDFTTESSFEEFGTLSGVQLIPPPPGDPVPEASTWAAMIGMTGVAGLTLWRRSRRAQAVALSN